MKFFYLIISIVLICIAHIIRLIRWNLFIEVYEKPDNKKLLQALTAGFMLNFIFPFKLGEIIRAWVAGKSLKNGKALGFSSVLIDRYLDVIFIGLIFIGLALTNSGKNAIIQNQMLFYVVFALALAIVTILLYTFKDFVKKVVCIIAKIFNDNIESEILGFSWALIWNFKDIFLKINKFKLLWITIEMWLIYMSSCYMFADFLSFDDKNMKYNIFLFFFGQNGILLSAKNNVMFWRKSVQPLHTLYILVYILAPSIILFVISFFIKKQESNSKQENYFTLFPHLELSERTIFLESYFSNSNRDYILNYLKINQGVSIIRDLSAGSNATTLLCMDCDAIFFRKCAFGKKGGEKLYEQIQWIIENRESLPLPKIIKWEKTGAYCFYDMSYSSQAIDLFKYVHSMPVERSWKIIQMVLQSLQNSIYTIDVRPADEYFINAYIDLKVNKNIEYIENAKFINNLQQYETIYINGVEYKNLPFYKSYLNREKLKKVFMNDKYSIIHGDLTIENIVCIREKNGTDDFYIIDPNTGNLHDSPNLDYAKLLQSLHGAYEFLMSVQEVSVNENQINFLLTRSAAYIELYELMKQYMLHNFSSEQIQSIYYHEIVHWLRLMPYKIKKDGKKSLVFYAGMLIVMNDVINLFQQ